MIAITEAKFVDGIQRYEYSSVICGGPTESPNDYGVVAVIDGSKLMEIYFRVLSDR